MKNCIGREEDLLQQSSEIGEKLFGFMEVDVDNLGYEVWGGLVLQLLKLQELLIQHSLLKQKQTNNKQHALFMMHVLPITISTCENCYICTCECIR